MGGKADGIFSGVRTVWAVGPSPRQGSGFADAVRSPQLLNTQMEDKAVPWTKHHDLSDFRHSGGNTYWAGFCLFVCFVF